MTLPATLRTRGQATGDDGPASPSCGELEGGASDECREERDQEWGRSVDVASVARRVRSELPPSDSHQYEAKGQRGGWADHRWSDQPPSVRRRDPDEGNQESCGADDADDRSAAEQGANRADEPSRPTKLTIANTVASVAGLSRPTIGIGPSSAEPGGIGETRGNHGHQCASPP